MRLPLTILFLALIPAWLPARMDVKANLASDTFLKYESIRFQITVTNTSRVPVRFGGTAPNSKLRLNVSDTQGRLMNKTKLALFPTPWTILPGETASRDFDLLRLFEIRRVGSYRLKTVVQFPDEVTLQDKTRLFNVVSGVEVSEMKIKSKDRTFTLLSLNRNRRDEVLMRISSHDETKVLQTYFLGPYLKFYTPTFQEGRNGQVAVLHHASPTEIVFTLFKTNGDPVKKQTLPTTASDPVRLVEDPELGFVVRGVESTTMEDDEEQ